MLYVDNIIYDKMISHQSFPLHITIIKYNVCIELFN